MRGSVLTLLVVCPVLLNGVAWADPPETEAQAAQIIENDIQAQHEQRELLQRRRFLRAQELSSDIAGEVALAKEAQQKWSSVSEALLDNDQGRRIAANPVLLEQVGTVFLYSRLPGPDRLDLFEKMFEPMREYIDALAYTETTSIVEDVMLQDLERQLRDITRYYQAYQNANAVFLHARDETAKSIVMAPNSLREAIIASEADLASKQARLSQLVIQAARRKADAEISQLKAELARARAQVRQAELESRAAAVSADADEIRKETQEDKLRRRAEDAVALFGAFTNKGYTYLKPYNNGNGGGSWTRVRDRPPKPVSFGSLATSGALADSEKGRSILLRLATDKRNDRSGGSWATPTTEAEWDDLAKRQALLRELGPTFVELGYLTP